MIQRAIGTQSRAFLKLRCGMSSDSGFGVAEIVVSMAILLVVAMGVLGSLSYAAAASRANATRQVGLSIADRQLEQARNLPFKDCGTKPGNPGGEIPVVQYFDASGSSVAQSAAVYTCTTTITWVSSTNFSKKIKIVVAWKFGPLLQDRNVTLNSTIVGLDPGNFGSVELIVRDADTNNLLSGASLTIQPSLGNPFTGSTGSTGSVTFIHVPSGTMTITNGTLTGYYLDIAAVNTGGPSVEPNTLKSWTIKAYRLSTGIVIVKDTKGNPLEGVSVKLTQLGSSTTSVGPVLSVASGKATFAADSVNGLRGGTTWIVSGSGDGYDQSSSTNLVITAGGQTYYDQTNGTSPGLVMVKIPVLSVIVKDSVGNPIQGALLSTITPSVTRQPTNGLTDDAGMASYWFHVGKPTTVSFTVSKAGYNTATAYTGVIVMGDLPIADPVNVVLTYAPVVVTVKVTNAAGTGLQNVQLDAISGATLSGLTNSSGLATYTFTNSNASVDSFTASLSGYLSGSGTVPAFTLPTASFQLPNIVLRQAKLAVTVTDQFNNAITAANLSAINGVSPVAASNVYTYTFPSAQAPTAFTALKTGYVTWSGNSLQTILDQTVAQTVVTGKPNLRIPFKFAAGDASSYTVYIYTKTGGALYKSFTVTKPSPLGTGVVTTDVPLLAAAYYLSCTGPAAPGTGKLTTPTLTQTLQTYPNGTSTWMTKSN